jgi:pseudouridine kinase
MAGIVVVGGANMDIKARVGDAHRLGTSNPGEISATPGGVARNIAHDLARLGRNVALVSCVGDDAYGNRLIEATAVAGVDVSAMLVTSTYPTGQYLAVIERNGEMVTAVSDMRVMELITPRLVDQHKKLFQNARFIIADCNLPVETLAHLAENVGQKLIIEPVSIEKSKKLSAIFGKHRLFAASPNVSQLAQLTGTNDLGPALDALHRLGLANVVVHMGEQGVIVSDGTTATHVEAGTPHKITDVTGAGDAALAGLVHGLMQDMSLVQAAAIGQAVASRVIASASSTLE